MACAPGKGDDAPIVNQISGSLGRNLWVAFVIGDNIVNLASIYAAGFIKLIECRLCCLGCIGKIGKARNC